MKISIIFPVYNKGPHLARAISSAIAQTYPDIEIIAVDDGSTDDSLERLKVIAKSYPGLIIHSQPNGGLSLARNAGLDLATGDYVLFHDADDYLEPDAVEHLVRGAQTHGSDIVGGVSQRLQGDKLWVIEKYRHDDPAMNLRTDGAKLLKYCANFSTSNKMFLRQFLLEQELRFTPRLYMQDIEFWLKAMLLSRSTTQIKNVISTYVFYDNSASRQRNPQRFQSLITLFNNLESFLEKEQLQHFATVKNIALMQGAFMFFTRWKLNEWHETGDATDIDKVRDLLLRIPEKDFLRFFAQFSRSSNAPVMLLVRSGHYDAALKAERAFQVSISVASRLAKRTLRLLPHRAVKPSYLRMIARTAGSDKGILAKQTVFGGAVTGAARRVAKLPRRLAQAGKTNREHLRQIATRTMGRLSFSSRRKQERDWPGHHVLVFGLGNLYDIGGVQLSYQHLFRHLCSKGFKITFYSHHAPKVKGQSTYYEFPREVSIHHYELDDTATNKAAIAAAVSSHAPDAVLIVNSGQPSLVIASALYDSDVPVVYSERGGTEHCLIHNWASRTQRELVHFASDFAHVLMPSYRSGAPHWLQDYVVAIPSLTEPATRFAASDIADADGRWSILYTGRLSFEKDIDILIRAFAQISDRFPAWRIDIYGKGPDQSDLAALAIGSGIGARVNFRGSTKSYAELSDAYAKAHIFALPSRAEGCPLSLREAMAHGLPVIGFDSCSGTNEIIFHERNGLLARSDDKVAGMREALERLMGDPTLRSAYGRNGIEDVKAFAPELTLDAWEGLLLRAIAHKGKRHELRAAKESKNPTEYAWLRRLFEASREAGVTRGLYAFRSGIRRGEFDAKDVKPYMLLFGSCLFNPVDYGRRYPDLKLSGQDPLLHYIQGGWRNDSSKDQPFDQKWYIDTQMNGVADSCPLAHYYEIGRYKDARPSPTAPPMLIRKVQKEITADGNVNLTFDKFPAEEVVEILMEKLTWQRLNWKLLRARPRQQADHRLQMRG